MKHIISFSGGKDSTAMLLRMIELNYPIDKIIFADTTLEFPEMYDWINRIEKLIKIHITRVTAKHSWDDWFYGKFTKGKFKGEIRGFPYVVNKCWWSRDCKIMPMKNEQGQNNMIYIGIAKDEERRAEAKQYKDSINEYRFPLIEWGWTEDDCINYLKSRGLEHPLQSKFKRTGCWLCQKQSLKSLKSLYLHYPELWNKLKQYEKDSPHGFKPNFSLDQFENKVKRELTQTTLLKIEKKMEMHKHSSGIEYVNPLMRDSAIFQKILNLLRIFDFSNILNISNCENLEQG